jgi:hypothetical protein
MFDIRTAPIEELLKDKRECEEDIALCQKAIQHGIVSRREVGVQSRINANKTIVAMIEAELARRSREAG